MNINPNENGYYVWDDMILNQQQFDAFNDIQHNANSIIGGYGSSGGIKGDQYRWKYGVLPYKFDPGLTDSQKRKVEDALNVMSNQLFPCVNIR